MGDLIRFLILAGSFFSSMSGIAAPFADFDDPARALGKTYASSASLIDDRKLNEGKIASTDPRSGPPDTISFHQKDGVNPGTFHLLLVNVVGAHELPLRNAKIRVSSEEEVIGTVVSYKVSYVYLGKGQPKDQRVHPKMEPALIAAKDAVISQKNVPGFVPYAQRKSEEDSRIAQIVGVAVNLIVALDSPPSEESPAPREVLLTYILELDASGQIIGGTYSRPSSPNSERTTAPVVLSVDAPSL